MCGPMIGMVGALVSAAGSIYSGMTQSAGYQAAAKSHEMQAQADLNAGSYQSARHEEKMARLTGQQITATAANGVGLSGSPMDVIIDSKAEGELDKAAIRGNWQQKSNIETFNAGVSRMNAGSAMTGGFIGALAPIVKGTSGFTGMSGAFGG